MFRLVAVTLAALFGILYVFGAEERRVEVGRQVTDDTVRFTLAALDVSQIDTISLPTKDFGVSDDEAVRLALEAGAALRGERSYQPRYGIVAAVDAAGVAAASPKTVAVEEAQPTMWYVTGNSVNLRAGPGTRNAVVGNLRLGAEAEVLGDKNGWYQIRTADGSASGWIFGKFLADARPG